MKYRNILFVLLAVLMTVSLAAQEIASEGSKLLEKIKIPEIKWKVPELGKEVIVDTLSNGIVLFMLEDHRLPTFNINAIVRTGSIYDPPGLEGLASLTGSVMRSGGTKKMIPDSLNAILEYLAASVETWIDLEQGGANVSCLAKDIDQCLPIFADVLMNPEFRQDQIDLRKSDIKNSIVRRNDDPATITRREFNHLIYGNHPYGRILEWESIKKITREDLLGFYSKYFAPNNLWLGITGDFNPAEIKAKLAELFAAWIPRKINFPAKPQMEAKYTPGVYIIDKDVSQTNIRFGLLGIKQDSPDRYAVAVMNYILGGGQFSSRIMSVVRSDMGLAYTVGSAFNTNSRDLGTFFAYCQTKTETTYKALFNMLDQVKKIAGDKVTERELNLARDAYINQFVFSFTNPAAIVTQLMNVEYDGMPRDYYKNYIANVEKVTRDDVLAVARKYLQPDNMTILLVGKAQGFEQNMTEFGKITHVNLEPPVVE